MGKQNFAATASYFQRRAEKVSSGRLRKQLEASADRYRTMAAACGHRSEAGGSAPRRISRIPPRRQRLIELFQESSHGVSELRLKRMDNNVEREEQSGVDEGRTAAAAPSSIASS